MLVRGVSTLQRGPVGRVVALLRDGGDMGAVLRGAGTVGLMRIGGVALAFMTQVFLARVMGAAEFGIYSYAWSWAALLTIPALLGLNTAVLRYIPEYTAKDDGPRLFGVVRASQALVLGVGVVVAAIGGAVVFLLGDFVPAYYVVPLYIALASIPLWALLNQQCALSRAFGWVALASFPRNIAAPSLLIAGVAILLAAGGEANGVTVLGVAAASFFIIVPLHRMRLRRRIGAALPAAKPRYETGVWLRVAFPLFLLSGFQIVLDRSDLIMLGMFLAPEDVALYQAAVKTSAVVAVMLAMLNFLGAPRIAKLHAEGRHRDLQKLVTGIVGWVFWPSLLAALIAILFGGSILKLFGPEFEGGALALAILAMGKLVHASTGPVGYLMALTGHQNASAKVFGTCAAINIALNLLLIPEFGLVGAAVATSLTLVLWNLWLLILVRRRLGIHSFVIPWPVRPTAGQDGDGDA